jgi:hypothetical protein
MLMALSTIFISKRKRTVEISLLLDLSATEEDYERASIRWRCMLGLD